MASTEKIIEAVTDPVLDKPRGRRWGRWVIGICAVLAVAVAAGVFWRLPLAGAVLRAGLDRAGFGETALTVSALTLHRVELTDVRLGSDLEIRTAAAHYELSRLPDNPFTRVGVDGVRLDLTGTDNRLRRMVETRQAEKAAPATIRALIDRVAGLPSVAIANLSMRYAPADQIVTLAGSVEAGPDDGGAYALRFSTQLSGDLYGESRAVALDGAARIARDAATVDVAIRTADGATDGRIAGRADLSSAAALIHADGQLETRDPDSLSALIPVLEGTTGKITVAAGTAIPVSIGLDVPLDASGLITVLQQAGEGGVTLNASVEDGSQGDGLQGVNAALSASLRGAPDRPGGSSVEGKLSFRARQVVTAGIHAEEVELAGPFRIARQDDIVTVVFPEAVRFGAKDVSTEDGKIAIPAISAALSGGRTHALRAGLGGVQQAELRLKLDVDAVRVGVQAAPARDYEIAPFTLRLAATVDRAGGMDAHIRIPGLTAAEGTQAALIEDLGITLQRSGSSITGKASGRVSAHEGGKPLFDATLVQSDFSLWRDVLTFDGKAILPGLSVATAKGRHDLFAGTGAATLALPAFRIPPGGTSFRALSPSLSGFDFRSGTMRARADLEWGGGAVDGAVDLGIEDLDLVYGAAATSVEGLTAKIRLSRILSPRTPPGQSIRIKRILAGVPLHDLSLDFSLIDGVAPDVPAMRIEAFGADFAGGRLSIAPAVLDTALDAGQATLAVQNVDLATLFGVVGPEGVSGTGRLSGFIPFKIVGKAVGIVGGKLAAAGPGVLRIRSDAAKTALGQGGPQVTLMLSALEDFRYETLTMEIEKEPDGEGRVILRTRGHNPAVRDGQPFVINLNVSGNVDRLVAVAAQVFSLPGALVRPMVTR